MAVVATVVAAVLPVLVVVLLAVLVPVDVVFCAIFGDLAASLICFRVLEHDESMVFELESYWSC